MSVPPVGERPTCSGHFTWYPDPKVATGVVVSRDEEILLVLRDHEPAYGRWSFPSGFVDAGEIVEQAAAREVREEAGLEVAIDDLLGVYSESGNQVIFVAYAGHVTGGTLAPGEEASDARFFHPDELPPLPFPHDGDVMAAWQQFRSMRRLSE
jgi:ADP-ribose pyrophosphatase YjhB (NUDIX family)